METWEIVTSRGDALRGDEMDAQYKFLKTVCRLSQGIEWVTYSEVKKVWRKCPEQDVIANLAKHTYVDAEHDSKTGDRYFPKPEAFSYVRQCRDSIRNLVITAATLLVAVWTFLATLQPFV